MKPIFSRNDDVNKTAFLNWRIDEYDNIGNMLNLADGFMKSSIKLAETCLVDNQDKSADILIFPILANANHGIELYLKSFIWILNTLLQSQQRIEGKHDIRKILETLKAKVKTYKGSKNLKEFKEIIFGLDKYIVELYDRIDATERSDNMDFSRYPINKSYSNHFYVQSVGNVVVDLENFIVRFKDIRSNLESIKDYLFYQELFKGL